MHNFPATRADALRAFEEFLPRAGRLYARDRNQDWGMNERQNVSGLSPAIRRRLITEQEIVHAVYESHGYQASEKFIQEVVWRTYWKGWLEARPTVWHTYRDSLPKLCQNFDTKGYYTKAIAGNTGIECFDAWAAELVDTGYLHNHTRMWFASIWIFTLNLPWQLGADFFYQHLLDADPASNTLSWRWVAGLQTVGKNYVARASNIYENTRGRFNPVGQLNENPTPIVPENIPPPQQLPVLETTDATLRSGLFITTEDLTVEHILPPEIKISAVAATDRIGGSPSALKRNYVETALSDGIARATCAPCTRLTEAKLVEEMVNWAEQHELQQIVTAYAPVGPVADLIAVARTALAAQNITLVQRQRRWDIRAWPYAHKGFFQMKAQIPGLLKK
jgi:deoxyribodipyrimidine photo-lyase